MSEATYQVLADLVLYVHAGFVIFVVLGQLLIIAGGVLDWAWVRNLRFRIIHLVAITIVVLQAWLGVLCPLTRIETTLRDLGGEAVYPGSFIAYWVEKLLYYDAPGWAFVAVYSAFGLLVLISWFRIRPCSPKTSR